MNCAHASVTHHHTSYSITPATHTHAHTLALCFSVCLCLYVSFLLFFMLYSQIFVLSRKGIQSKTHILSYFEVKTCLQKIVRDTLILHIAIHYNVADKVPTYSKLKNSFVQGHHMLIVYYFEHNVKTCNKPFGTSGYFQKYIKNYNK